MRITQRILSSTLGVLFLVTGWLKGVDPYGTSLKLKEYFQWLGWNDLQQVSMELAVILCAAEIAMGFFLWFGIYRRITAWAVLGFMLVFTLLTGYLAFSFNSGIQECGCFGQAFTMSNEATFAKNIVLLLLSAGYLWMLLKTVPQQNKKEKWLGIYGIAFAMAIPLYSAIYLPPFDFLSYNRGVDLKAHQEFAVFTPSYTQVKDSLLKNSEKPLLAVIAQRELTSQENLKLQALKAMQQKGEIRVCVLASASQSCYKGIDTYYVDLVTLKSLVRAETGLVAIYNGRIEGKWKLNRFPIKEGYENSLPKNLKVQQKYITELYWGIVALGLILGGVLGFLCRKKKTA